MGYTSEKNILLNCINNDIKPDKVLLSKCYRALETIEAIEDIWRSYFRADVSTAPDYMIEIREELRKF